MGQGIGEALFAAGQAGALAFLLYGAYLYLRCSTVSVQSDSLETLREAALLSYPPALSIRST
jgi:hypothetical protein